MRLKAAAAAAAAAAAGAAAADTTLRYCLDKLEHRTRSSFRLFTNCKTASASRVLCFSLRGDAAHRRIVGNVSSIYLISRLISSSRRSRRPTVDCCSLSQRLLIACVNSLQLCAANTQETKQVCGDTREINLRVSRLFIHFTLALHYSIDSGPLGEKERTEYSTGG